VSTITSGISPRRFAPILPFIATICRDTEPPRCRQPATILKICPNSSPPSCTQTISLGGLNAQDFAARHPALVSRLILIDTTPRYTDDMRAMWAQRAATARDKGVATLVDGLLKIWFSADAIAKDLDGVRYVRSALSRCDGEGYALACEALAKADLRGLATRIKAPTLVICGDDDIPGFLDAARWLSANIAGAELSWIAGARHASVLEKPADTIPLMKSFLRNNPVAQT
jgi:3-oxoadipate enol-lactonase